MDIQTKYADASNYQEGRSGTIKYIVLHYTANDGDTAKGNCNYFQGKNRGASAHYFVDETSVWQSVRDTDTAWSVGGGLQSSGGHAFYKICTNNNSISIEMCSKIVNGVYTIPEKTVDNAVGLTKQLMGTYNIPIDRIIRHYDVNGKICPRPWVEDETQWAQFKNRLEGEEIDMEELQKLRADLEYFMAAVDRLGDRITKLENPTVYNYIDSVPTWARDTVQKLCDKGILVGDGTGLALTDDMLRTLTLLDRAGTFDK